MQNNSTSIDLGLPKSPPPKPQRSPSLNPSHGVPPTRIQDIPPTSINQRFSLTPQNVGMEVKSIAQCNNKTPEDGNQQTTPYAKHETHPTGSTSKGDYKKYPSNIEETNYAPDYSQYRRNASLPNTTTNDRQCTASQRTHERTSLPELPMDQFQEQYQKFRSISDASINDPPYRINEELNNVYRKRLDDINMNCQGDLELKCLTYSEWVETLLKVNQSLISNIHQLELEVYERLEYLQRRANSNCRHSQGNELMKCRKDIDSLLRFIQNSCKFDVADLSGVNFETISFANFYVSRDNQMDSSNVDGTTQQVMNTTDPDIMQRNKLNANIKALAFEVAEKHDEVRELRRQVNCLEDEIQKATKKIQLKEDVIKELRNDLKRNVKSTGETYDMAPIHLDTPRSEASTLVMDGNNMNCSDEAISQIEHLSQCEGEKLNELSGAINELFKRPFPDIIRKIEAEKAAAFRKLDFLRRQIIDLESSEISHGNLDQGDNDSGISSKNEYDQETKILDSVRKRLRKLNDNNVELNKQVQKLQLENNELSANLKSEKNISQRNSKILKDMADLLSSMNANFSYANIYTNNTNQHEDKNPFCQAIIDMELQYQARETNLQQELCNKNQRIESLTEALLKHEKLFGEQKRVNQSLKRQIQHLELDLSESKGQVVHLMRLLQSSTPHSSSMPSSCRAKSLECPGQLRMPPNVVCCDSRQQISELEKRVERLSKNLDESQRQESFLRSEIRKLNEELNESKRRNGNLVEKTQHMAGLLKSQENHRLELAKKYDSLEKNFDDQSKKLRAADAQLRVLGERLKLMEKDQQEHKIERDILRNEVLSLKEKEAVVVGRQKSMQEQLIKTEKELYNAHEVIKDQQMIFKSNDLKHAEELQRIREEKYDIQRDLKNLTEDFRRLEEAYNSLRSFFPYQKRTGD
ncbi:yuri gagarin isoform X2 [Haematobia irritans]|uniref:yuri gagarin isoform X2 n=1 Tax=Haematobia irritans TaxID=7368 RepID=UPI003F4F9547